MKKSIVLTIVFSLLLLFKTTEVLALNDVKADQLEQKLYAFKNSETWDDGFLKIRRFTGFKGLAVGYGVYGKEIGKKGAVVISVGRTESSFKYYQFAEDAMAKGYSPILVLEHRGQGTSERILKKSDAGTVEDFQDYVEDFRIFINKIVPAELSELKTTQQTGDVSLEPKLFLLAHSMGGGIAAVYLTQNTSPFTAAVFSSPMFKVKLPGPESLFSQLGHSLCQGRLDLLGLCDDYVALGKPYKANLKFEDNKTTSDRNQFDLEMLQNNLWPEIRLGSPTQRWLLTTIKATEKLREDYLKMNLPFLVIQGEHDDYVDNSAHQFICGRHALCDLKTILGSKHEPLIERPSLRDEALNHLFNFYDSH